MYISLAKLKSLEKLIGHTAVQGTRNTTQKFAFSYWGITLHAYQIITGSLLVLFAVCSCRPAIEDTDGHRRTMKGMQAGCAQHLWIHMAGSSGIQLLSSVHECCVVHPQIKGAYKTRIQLYLHPPLLSSPQYG